MPLYDGQLRVGQKHISGREKVCVLSAVDWLKCWCSSYTRHECYHTFRKVKTSTTISCTLSGRHAQSTCPSASISHPLPTIAFPIFQLNVNKAIASLSGKKLPEDLYSLLLAEASEELRELLQVGASLTPSFACAIRWHECLSSASLVTTSSCAVYHQTSCRW